MKIDLSGVSETLLVTLYMRAKDAKSPCRIFPYRLFYFVSKSMKSGL